MLKSWHDIAGGIALLTANGTVLVDSFAVSEASTVLRMIGEYIIGPTVAPEALDAATIAVAIGVVSADAATLGSTAMPDPILEPDYPWLYRKVHGVYFPTNTATNASAQASVRQSIDVKSMRKLKPRESLALVVEYFDDVGAPPIRFFGGSIRVLFAS